VMMTSETDSNIYLVMPLSRVFEDAQGGVSLARRALAERDPERARAMGIGIEPEQQKARVVAAVGDYLAGARRQRRNRVGNRQIR